MTVDKYYPAHEDAALYISSELCAYIVRSCKLKDGLQDTDISLPLNEFAIRVRTGTLNDPGITNLDIAFLLMADTLNMEAFYGFTGNVLSLLPERAMDPLDLSLYEATVPHIASAATANLFEAPYSSPEALQQEFAARFSACGIDIPADFDWWRHIVSLSGCSLL